MPPTSRKKAEVRASRANVHTTHGNGERHRRGRQGDAAVRRIWKGIQSEVRTLKTWMITPMRAQKRAQGPDSFEGEIHPNSSEGAFWMETVKGLFRTDTVKSAI